MTLWFTQHHTINSYEKMQAGPHAFQNGQYEHEGYLLTLFLFAKRLTKSRNSQKPLMSNLKLAEHLTSYSDSDRESSVSGPVHNRSIH